MSERNCLLYTTKAVYNEIASMKWSWRHIAFQEENAI